MREKLQQRAVFLSLIRNFFKQRGVMEVETPVLCQHTVTDVHIESFQCEGRYLQTSPEYAMKRLLAAGSGPIFQISKAFRKGECGRNHNPEFSMLEWYQPGYNYKKLIIEIDELLQLALKTKPCQQITYQNLFQKYLNIDPLEVTEKQLHQILQDHKILNQCHDIDKDTALQLLLTHLIEPSLGLEQPLFIINFPSSQSALAKISADDSRVSERFEAYYKGSEIANGWTELTDPVEQVKRFEQDQKQRHTLHKTIPGIDHFFIDSLKAGLPECAGVAMGVDRLLMLAYNLTHINQAISFDWINI